MTGGIATKVSSDLSSGCPDSGAGSPLARLGIPEETLVGRIVAGLTAEYHIFMTNWANCDVEQKLKELIPRLSAEVSLIKKIDKSNAYAMVGESSNKNQSAGH